MTNPLPKVLFTRSLNKHQKSILKETCFGYEEIPFILLEKLDKSGWIEQAAQEVDAWLFTSQQAVESISNVLNELPIPNVILSVGASTTKYLSELGLTSIHPENHTLKDLTTLIPDSNIKSIIHFCGNLKASELSELLGSDSKIVVKYVQVYKNTLNLKKIDADRFDGIVYMSPSAVQSYFEYNSDSSHHRLFCIGTTTATELAKYTSKPPVLPEQFTFAMLSKAIKQTLC